MSLYWLKLGNLEEKLEFEHGHYTLPETYGAPKKEGIPYAQERRSKSSSKKQNNVPVKVKK